MDANECVLPVRKVGRYSDSVYLIDMCVKVYRRIRHTVGRIKYAYTLFLTHT